MKKETKIDFAFDNLGAVHSSIQDESSPPSDAAVAAAIEETAQLANENAATVDTKKETFNPELHAVDKDGKPSLTALGKFRRRRGASKVSVTNQQVIDAQKKASDDIAARAAGQLAADLMIGSCVGILGEEWNPIGAKGEQQPIQFDEHSNLRRAFGDYFVAKGINDFPPGIMLSIAMSSYAMPRIVAGKETQSRLTRAKVWVAEKYYNLRSKKNATQPDTRNDGKRENDDSKKAVRDVKGSGTRNPST